MPTDSHPGPLAGRVVLVTGAAGTIGAGIVPSLIDAGAKVLAAYRSNQGDLHTYDSAVVRAVSVDLHGPGAATMLVNAALDAFGRLDAVINNAADQRLGALTDGVDATWTAMLETNLSAVQRLCAAAIPALTQTGGSIVHIASIEASTPAPAHGAYAVSKAALVMHAKALALELGPVGIRVNAVSPGLIHRPGIEDAWPEGVNRYVAAAPLRRLGTPADVAAACVFLCSPAASWITGVDLTVDGGVSCHPHW